MGHKKLRIVYWTILILLCLMLLLDAFGGITRQQAGVDVMNHLGYPEYLLTLSGIAKLCAIIAILQNRFDSLKEWAFAGLAFNLILGFASRAFVGDGLIETTFPLIILAFVLLPYFLWKKIYLPVRI